MVTCTRARCYGSEACDCMRPRSKKRQMEDADEASYPRKTRKIRTNCAHPRVDSNSTNSRGNIQARGPICSSIDGDAVSREAHYNGDASTAECLQNSHRSGSTSRREARSCSGQDCLHPCVNTCVCTPVSPTLRGKGHEQKSTIMARAKCGICKRMESSTGEAEICILRTPTTSNEAVVHLNEAVNAQKSPLEDESPDNNGMGNVSDRVPALGPSIPPPTNPSTPPEYVPQVSFDPQFLQEFTRAYDMSQYSDTLRAHKYRHHVAAEYRRGFTPKEFQERWQSLAEQYRADTDASCASEGCECV